MMLYIELCYPLLQAWSKLPNNLFLIRLPYMLRTCLTQQQNSSPPKDLSLRNMSNPLEIPLM